MIELKKDGAKISFDVNVQGYTIPFSFTSHEGLYSKLLHDEIQDKLWNHMEEIRRKAYNQGWSDKSKHKRKEDYFSGQLKRV